MVPGIELRSLRERNCKLTILPYSWVSFFFALRIYITLKVRKESTVGRMKKGLLMTLSIFQFSFTHNPKYNQQSDSYNYQTLDVLK